MFVCRLFYFFFESRGGSDDPVVLWLTGGPGCSSELALFYENGPFIINDNLTLTWNNYGWDKVSSFQLITLCGFFLWSSNFACVKVSPAVAVTTDLAGFYY